MTCLARAAIPAFRPSFNGGWICYAGRPRCGTPRSTRRRHCWRIAAAAHSSPRRREGRARRRFLPRRRHRLAWTVEQSADADADSEAIFDFLVESGMAFGEPMPNAVDRAAARLACIDVAVWRFATGSHRGTLHPEPGDGI